MHNIVSSIMLIIFDYYKSISDYRSSDSYFDPFLC